MPDRNEPAPKPEDNSIAKANTIYSGTKSLIGIVQQLRLNGAVLILFDQGERHVLSFAADPKNTNDIQQLAVELHKRMFEGDIAVPPSLG